MPPGIERLCVMAQAGTQFGDDSTFIWADRSEFVDFSSTGSNQFNIRAAGGVRLPQNTNQFFGNQTRQMLNLWGTQYGIGVQTNTLYFRSGHAVLGSLAASTCHLPNCPYPIGTVGTETCVSPVPNYL